jgi:Alkylmercury lyase
VDAIAVRRFVYDVLLARGTPPLVSEIASHFDTAPDDAWRALAGLKLGKTLLVHPESCEIWMAGPFAAAETPYRVSCGTRSWWANCAWDMFGIAMIVGKPVRIDAHCTDCGEPVTLRCDPDAAPNEDGVIHFLLPARRWYDDIGFT